MSNVQTDAAPDSRSEPPPHRVGDTVTTGPSNGATSLMASVLFVAVVLVMAWYAESPALAVYALGFWHYLLYWLAFRYGAVPLVVFKRDAVLMKSVSLLALACVYLAAPLHVASLSLAAAGFLLNVQAARVLGSDRTYYGYEVAGLPPRRVLRFPYSVISHPMLVGNMLAYAGLLLNTGFREQWWPLACVHVLLNLGLLVMERHVTPLRRARNGAASPAGRRGWPRALALSAIGAALAMGWAWLVGTPSASLAATLGAVVALYGHVLFSTYAAPIQRTDAVHRSETESST